MQIAFQWHYVVTCSHFRHWNKPNFLDKTVTINNSLYSIPYVSKNGSCNGNIRCLVLRGNNLSTVIDIYMTLKYATELGFTTKTGGRPCYWHFADYVFYVGIMAFLIGQGPQILLHRIITTCFNFRKSNRSGGPSTYISIQHNRPIAITVCLGRWR